MDLVEREEQLEKERTEDEARWRRYETGEYVSGPEMDRWLSALQRGKKPG